MIKKITSLLCIFLIAYSGTAYAAPFGCDAGGVFDNKNGCEVFCQDIVKLPCQELEFTGNGEACNTSIYRGFAYVSGKTFALTKNSVNSGWADNAAIIRDEIDNNIIASILKSEGVDIAWIGASDQLKTSTSYGSVDLSRFRWKNGKSIEYSSWKDGEPNNSFNKDAVGVGSLYGEYWAVIDQSGKWNDVGLNADGSEKLYPAVVEWNGELACVAGKYKTVESKPTGMVCGEEDAALGFKFDSCSQGEIFGGGSGFLCPKQQMQCIESVKHKTIQETIKKSGEFASAQFNTTTGERQFKWIVTNNKNSIFVNVERRVKINTGIFGTHYNYKDTHRENLAMIEGDTKIISAMLKVDGVLIDVNTSKTIYDWKYKPDSVRYEYEAVIEKVVPYPVYTCPQNGRPCIENGGKYYCSSLDCSDGSNSGNYDKNPNETEEGKNDADDKGATDENGNCLGKLTIFPGVDSRCRLPGTQSSQFQCCKVVEPDEKDKPDFHLSKLATAAILYVTGFGALAALFYLVGPDGFDFKVCTGNERQLWVNRGNDLCYDVGSYCAEKWQGSGCVQRKRTFCCFDSDFSRAFNEAGVDMLGRNWGTPENPRCGGFTPEELQSLSAMNISEHPKMRGFADKLGTEYSDKLKKEFDKSFNKEALEGQIKQQVEGM